MHYLWWSKPWFLSIFLKCFGFLKTFFVGWRHARHLWYGQGRPGWPHQAALRSELFRLRREVHHGARGEEERGWDPRPGAGGQRHARQVHHPRPQESEQLQADGWRGVIRISFPDFFYHHVEPTSNFTNNHSCLFYNLSFSCSCCSCNRNHDRKTPYMLNKQLFL